MLILTGFLGSGKTTILTRYLSTPAATRTAVIVNEYGSVQIDGDLVTYAGDTTVVETTTGCLCCSISGDVRGVLLDLQDRISSGVLSPVHRVIIETTGLADPGSLVHALGQDERLAAHYTVAGVVAVIDALRGEHWFERFEEARRQVALSDMLVMSKTDLIEDPVSNRELRDFERRLKASNPIADILDARSVSGEDIIETAFNRRTELNPRASVEPAHMHGHSPLSFSLAFNEQVDADELIESLSELGQRFERDLIRAKGIVAVKGDDDALLIQCVAGKFEFVRLENAPFNSRLVVICEAISPAAIEDSLLKFGAQLEGAEAVAH